ncbi:MAG: alpha-D-ribose 1-methylphosphonate 5-triphosphate diphosphatase [Bradyrhizobiaceae bacterium]|nr:alpha-D-ribose 1-methylphosphonate 5-triphosphate diphosphatase [Bradyrhizobiaceae bacterium]
MQSDREAVILSNARIVLGERVIERGWLAIVDGKIAEIGEGKTPERGEDFEGDLLIPGLVELHTDHLEAHFMPRPKVYWDPVAAVVSYDGQLATSGITTVLDSLRIWREEDVKDADGHAEVLADAIAAARAGGLLRADHFLHLRCEVPMPRVVEEAAELIGRPDVRLVSLMDHTPGQRQFRDEEKLRTYYRGKNGGLTEAELDAVFETRRRFSAEHGETNYRRLVEMAKTHGRPLASHDDTTLGHVRQAVDDEVAIAEFPTTMEAAGALHAAGIRVLMGAPNLVRGGSHSGNVATAELAKAGVLDALSSDYVPASLLMAALALPEAAPGIDLPAAICTVTKTPAEAVGLMDRGEIAPGKRADLVRVRRRDNVATARSVWREGRRVA